ncbi:hypothetical protein IAQ61_005731 [Plenodomus lingam]|uniref:DNA-directed RNA polymerase I subunit RPA43 n=1 Tax=Leptosphaeria maculans (strain JN3 / isolate v23.1.3 / race Av1-4-5-6-7-8) TaxID=985895 RepID=E4ZMP9_LEPMJ|nr:hypothetical protein LEMA_P056240.1 [Plenodomus lingam JN3]KAH9870258.1 hypothetical protein IAQ61_005731 [Plenodomus lingam]CBX92918.1 hypothetical protein LEMA_P056240.1 [Plenodomus lingam JN3]
MAPIQADNTCLLYKERIAQYVSLPPSCLSTPLPALCASIFSPLLLSYFPPARGIVLAYEDVELRDSPPPPPSNKSAAQRQQQRQQESDSDDAPSPDPILLLHHIDEYASPFLWATATFLVFRPTLHAPLTGTLTHQSRTHITLSYLNTFPVSVLAAHLPSTWSWQVDSNTATTTAARYKNGWDGRLRDEGGCWVIEGEGKAESGRSVEVRIRDFDGRLDGKGKGKGFLRIEGSLLGKDEEAERLQKGKERA